MEDQKTKDSITSVIRNKFYQILEEQNIQVLIENEYVCNSIIQQIQELFFSIYQQERQTQNQSLKLQYTKLKEYCQSLSHEKFEMQKELQKEIIKLTEEANNSLSKNTILNEELNILKLKNEQLLIENKRIVSEQEILLCQINEQRIHFQNNIQEMKLFNIDKKSEVDTSKEKNKKLEGVNEKQHQQIKEYQLYIQKQQNKIKEMENLYHAETEANKCHLNDLDQSQKNIRELELHLRKSNEDNVKQQDEYLQMSNQQQEYEKQIIVLENLLNEKKKEIISTQQQQEQLLELNEENQKKFILSTVNKYKEKIQKYKSQIQEYKDKQQEYINKIHKLQLQDNEEKNGYQKQIQHIESKIQQVQNQYESIITNIKTNQKNELDNLKEGYEKDLQYKELQYKSEITKLELQMKENIKMIEDKTVSKELYESLKKDKLFEIEKIEKENNFMIKELNNTIKQLNQQIDKFKEQNNTFVYQNAQTESLQNKNKYNEDEIQRLNQELQKKQIIMVEQKERVKSSIQEVEKIEREKLLLSEEMKNLEEQNNEQLNKYKDIEKKMCQQIKVLKDKSEQQEQENYKITTQLRDIRKEQEIERKQNQELLTLLEKKAEDKSSEGIEVQTLRNTNSILQEKIENLNDRFNDIKQSYDEIRKEKEHMTKIVETLNIKIRIAEDFKIKFNIKIKQIMKVLHQLKEEINIGLQKEFVEKLAYIKQEYFKHVVDLANRIIQLKNQSQEEKIQLIHTINQLQKEFDFFKQKYQSFQKNQDEQQKNKQIQTSYNKHHKRSKTFQDDKKINYYRKDSKEKNINSENSFDEENIYVKDKQYKDSQKEIQKRTEQRDRNQIYQMLERQQKQDKYQRSSGDEDVQNNEEQLQDEQININSYRRYSEQNRRGSSYHKNHEQIKEENLKNQDGDQVEQSYSMKNNKDREKKQKQIYQEDENRDQDINNQLKNKNKQKDEILSEYFIEDLKRLKNENQEIIEEKIILFSKIDDLQKQLKLKEVEMDKVNQEIKSVLKQQVLIQSENSHLRKRISEYEVQVRKIEEVEKLNQELVIQDSQVREESEKQNKLIFEQLQKEIARYKEKEINDKQIISKQEIVLQDKDAQLNRLQLIQQSDKTNFEFKTKLLTEQKENDVTLHTQDQQIIEYRDEIQNLLFENSQLFKQIQQFQTNLEGLQLALEKARIQIQIADQRESQLISQNKKLQEEVLECHLNIQKLTNEISQQELTIQNERLKLKQKSNLKKEKYLLKEKLEQQNIKEIHKMIENSYLTLKNKNQNTFKSSIQLANSLLPSNNTIQNKNYYNQAQKIGIQNDISNDLSNSNSQKNLSNQVLLNENMLKTKLNKIPSVSGTGLTNVPFQILNQQQNSLNIHQNRSQKNQSLHQNNVFSNQNNNNNINYSNLLNNNFINKNSKENSSFHRNSLSLTNKIQDNTQNSSQQYLLPTNLNKYVYNYLDNNHQESEYNNQIQTNTSENPNHLRCQSQYQPHNKPHNLQTSSTSALFNNKNKCTSIHSTNIPTNILNTSTQQYNFQFANKQQSNSKSQQNIFSSNNDTIFNTNENNYSLIKNQFNAQPLINDLFKAKTEMNTQEDINFNYKPFVDEKCRGKSLSNKTLNTLNDYESKYQDDYLLTKKYNLNNPKQVDELYSMNYNKTKEINNYIKEESNKAQNLDRTKDNKKQFHLDLLKLNNQAQKDSSISKKQQNSKLNQLLYGSIANNSDNLNIDRLSNKSDNMTKNIYKFQELDSYLLRPKQQSHNLNTISHSVKNNVNQSAIPLLQTQFLTAENTFSPNSGISKMKNNENKLTNCETLQSSQEQINHLLNINGFLSKTNNDLNSSEKNFISKEDILQKQNPLSNRTEGLHITPPTQSLKSQQLQNKPSNSQKESINQKDDTTIFTPFSNNYLQEVVSFQDNDILDIIGNNILNKRFSSDKIQQSDQQNNFLNKNNVEQNNRVSDLQKLYIQQQQNQRKTQSFHINQAQNE